MKLAKPRGKAFLSADQEPVKRPAPIELEGDEVPVLPRSSRSPLAYRIAGFNKGVRDVWAAWGRVASDPILEEEGAPYVYLTTSVATPAAGQVMGRAGSLQIWLNPEDANGTNHSLRISQAQQGWMFSVLDVDGVLIQESMLAGPATSGAYSILPLVMWDSLLVPDGPVLIRLRPWTPSGFSSGFSSGFG